LFALIGGIPESPNGIEGNANKKDLTLFPTLEGLRQTEG
jgi:hypothetical protein